MLDPLLEYLNTTAVTHSYLETPLFDIPVLHGAITRYTQSPSVRHEYTPKEFEAEKLNSQFEHEDFDIGAVRLTAPDDVPNVIKIRLYTMQLRLEIVMSEFRLAAGTIARLKDLFASLGVQDEVGPLSLIILLRSELLETEAYVKSQTLDEDSGSNKVQMEAAGKNKKKNKGEKKEDSPFDHLAKVKNIVGSYIESSSELVINSLNRDAAISVTSSGVEAMRESSDLYTLVKRKAALDQNIATLSTLISVDEKNKIMINPVLAINESINALNDLIREKPLDVETYIELANLFLANGKLKEALWCVGETLLVGCSGAWNIWSFRGELCLLQSKYIQQQANGPNKANTKKSVGAWLLAAIASFSHSIELCDDYCRAWCGLYIALGRLIVLDPETDSVHRKLIGISKERLINLKTAGHIPIAERENIAWVLNNK